MVLRVYESTVEETRVKNGVRMFTPQNTFYMIGSKTL